MKFELLDYHLSKLVENLSLFVQGRLKNQVAFNNAGTFERFTCTDLRSKSA
jgi:hypothetical protein